MQAVTVVIPMYRTGPVTLRVIEALNRCRVPEGVTLSVMVVDDQSADGSAELIEAAALPFVRVARKAINGGRSAARNHGASMVTEGHILFLDSDCIPKDDQFLAHHLAALDTGASVSMGDVLGNEDGFWHTYQAAARERRHHASSRYGIAMSGSSQNFMIHLSAFNAVGGFDEGYSNYGFEDRDLFLRVEALGHRFAWAHDAVVHHRDILDLRRVCSKMAEAGGDPAVRFHARHPTAYARLGYGRFDARRRACMRLIEPATTRLVHWLAPWVSAHLNTTWLPTRLRIGIVRAMVAASYLHGTIASKDQRFMSR